MNWKELMFSNPTAALQIKKYVDESCGCGKCEKVETFSFEEKEGIVCAVGSNDKVTGILPLWYIPGKHAKYPDSKENGYSTEDPDEREQGLISAAGFELDRRNCGSSPFDSVLKNLSSLKH